MSESQRDALRKLIRTVKGLKLSLPDFYSTLLASSYPALGAVRVFSGSALRFGAGYRPPLHVPVCYRTLWMLLSALMSLSATVNTQELLFVFAFCSAHDSHVLPIPERIADSYCGTDSNVDTEDNDNRTVRSWAFGRTVTSSSCRWGQRLT